MPWYWAVPVTMGLLATLLALYFLFLAWTYRVRKARFEVISDDDSRTVVRTDVCRFTIDRDERVVVVETAGRTRGIPFPEVRKLAFRLRTSPTAQLLTVDWYEISLVLTDAEEVPLFLAGQTVRQKLQENGWYAEVWILSRARLFRDVGDISREVLDYVLASFGRSGLKLSIA
jgi:hypothetical protein